MDIPKPKRRPLILCNIFHTQYDLIKELVVGDLGWKLSHSEEDEESDIYWTDNMISPDFLQKMKQYEKINHFPGMNILARKNHLAYNLSRMQKVLPSEYDFFPRTWSLPVDLNDLKQNFSKKKTYIVKPESLSQGKGIFLTKRLENINLEERLVVEEYIKDPLLIEGLKFDLRIYVLVTSCNPLRVFIHEEGLTRLATEVYMKPTLKNIDEACMHLTNYAINKNSSNFVFNQDAENGNSGHKRTLKSTYEYLEEAGYNIDKLKREIDMIIIKTILAGEEQLAHMYKCCQPHDPGRGMCFQILGFDILIDSTLKPWLLEVNHSPSFTADTPLDHKIKRRVLHESLIIIDVKARNRKQWLTQKKNELELRMFHGKKESKESKIEAYKEAEEKKTRWENNHLGGFRRLFPVENERIRQVFEAAEKVWNEWTGKKPPKEVEKSIPKINKKSPSRHPANQSPTAIRLPILDKPKEPNYEKLLHALEQKPELFEEMKAVIVGQIRERYTRELCPVYMKREHPNTAGTSGKFLVPVNFDFCGHRATTPKKRPLSDIKSPRYFSLSSKKRSIE